MRADVELPEAFIEEVAERVAAKLATHDTTTPWMTRTQAAQHLGVATSRLEKDRTVPSHRWNGRILYNRDELNTWMLNTGS